MFAIRTARLLLRDFVEADWAAIYALSQEPAVTRYQSWLRLAGEADARRWLHDVMYHNQLQPRQAYNLAIVEQQVIGWIGWGRADDPALGDYSFGYALHPAAWDKGYMTEALRAACDVMFDALHADRIVGECASSNQASARVMEKVGMQVVHIWQERNAQTGAYEEQRRYAIGKTAWRRNDHT